MLTDEQIKERLGKVTSSTIGAVLGVHPHMSQLQAWRAIKEGPRGDGNKATERGNVLESVVLEWAAERLDGRFLERNATKQLSEPWAADTTDAVLDTDKGVALLEAKTVAQGGAAAWGDEGTDQIPLHVVAQCHWHLLAHPNAISCYVPVLFGGFAFEFAMYEIARDDAMAAKIFAKAKRWHSRYIVGGDEPPPGASDSDTEFLKQRYPSVQRDYLDATEEIENLAREYHEASQAAKEADERKSEAGNALRAAVKDAAGARSERCIVTYKETKGRTTTDWRAVALECVGEDSPFVQKHTRTGSGGRTLRVTWKG